MKSAPGDNGRLAALKLLASVLEQGLSLAESNSESAIDPSRMDRRDVAFAKHLAYGVLRWLGALEWLSGQLLRRPFKARDRDIQRLVLIGLYQLWSDTTEPYAAVHETAECARQLGKPWAVAVINAVLRRFQREQDSLLQRLERRDDRYAHPAWMLTMLQQDWPDDWESIVEANNQAAPLWLRLRRDRDTSEITEQLEQQGYLCGRHALAPDALRISPAAAVSELPGFDAGLISVQDPAAQLAADLLDLAPGQRVLDACAAPGGKTSHMLEIEPEISMIALDRARGRLELVRQNLARLGLDARPDLVLLDADAAEPGSWWDGKPFQRILLDAPCTASGVIRRHPEIKWLRTPRQLEEAVALQARLLDRLWPLLDTGGILLYATCSVFKDENSRQIEQFLGHHRDTELTEIDAEWGHRPNTGRQILPGEQDMDGFYYARLRKH